MTEGLEYSWTFRLEDWKRGGLEDLMTGGLYVLDDLMTIRLEEWKTVGLIDF